MGTIISWVRISGWTRSPFGDLPSLRVDDGQTHQTWLILMGGLALILSRASRGELESRFAAAHELYQLARPRLQKRKLPKPDPTLLRDALHEIANMADPMTKEAGRECLARCVDRLSQKNKTAAATASSLSANSSHGASTHTASTQAASTHAASSQEPTQILPVNERDPEETQLDLDLLFERSAKLRDTVAWARTTTFGENS